MNLTPDQLAEYERRATMLERKRCAEIAEQEAASTKNGGAINACRAIARAIRKD